MSNREIAVGDIIERPESGTEFAVVTVTAWGPLGELQLELEQHTTLPGQTEETVSNRRYVVPADGSIRRVNTVV